AELLESETGVSFDRLGAVSGLSPAPWREAPVEVPDGPDATAWSLATDRPLPARDSHLPHDANARAGMKGHAGFAATPQELEAALRRWTAAGWPARMAVDAAPGEDGARWGLGLQVAFAGAGRFGQLLSRLPEDLGCRILEDPTDAVPRPAPLADPVPGPASGWWFHLGYTGPALFYRPSDGSCVALLLHRRGPGGCLLDAESLRSRRWACLKAWVDSLV
ncbi:MAG TPA: serine hydrolase, partial [Holophagaceae bacterium]